MSVTSTGILLVNIHAVIPRSKISGKFFFPYIIRVDWVGRARIIPTSDHLVRGVIRFPHSNPADIIRFPLEIGSASCTLSSCNLRRISLNIKLNVYSPWNCQVIFLEEFALHVMYSGHSIKALVLHQCESTPKSHNKIRKFLWKKVRRARLWGRRLDCVNSPIRTGYNLYKNDSSVQCEVHKLLSIQMRSFLI